MRRVVLPVLFLAALLGASSGCGVKSPPPPGAPRVGPGKAPPVKIEAKVLASRTSSGLVMLSVGSDDGVERGRVFTIRREGRYVGKVVVERVFPNMCSARVLDLVPGEDFAEGDDASTSVRQGPRSPRLP